MIRKVSMVELDVMEICYLLFVNVIVIIIIIVIYILFVYLICWTDTLALEKGLRKKSYIQTDYLKTIFSGNNTTLVE